MELKKFRQITKKTQEEVAKELNLQKQTYQNYELAKREPDNAMLVKLADYFHVTIDELLGHEVPYTLNRVEFSQEQLELIEQIKSLNAKQCEKVGDFVSGMLEAQRIKDNTLKRQTW